MPRTSDPAIDPLDYLSEALDAFHLLCTGPGARKELYREVVHHTALVAIGEAAIRLSDLDRLHALFDAAASEQAARDPS